MVLKRHIRWTVLLIFLTWPVIASWSWAQEECHPHKRAAKAITRLFGVSPEISPISISEKDGSNSDLTLPGDCIYTIRDQETLLGYLLSTSGKGRYDDFDYSVIFDHDKRILQVIVTVYRSNHGASICQKNWLDQFEGYKGGKLILGSDIDAVSGGTLSATSMVQGIQRCHLLISSLDAE